MEKKTVIKKITGMVLMAVMVISGVLMAGCSDKDINKSATASVTEDTSVTGSSSTTVPGTDGNTYKVYNYTPPKKIYASYSFKNLALKKAATSSCNYPGFMANGAVDGSLDTLWASTGDYVNPWIQIDLGTAVKIGSVEVVPRKDSDTPSLRTYYQIEVSNDPTFKKFEVVGVQGSMPLSFDATFIASWSNQTKFRYVRLQRTNSADHIALSEIRVYEEQIKPEEKVIETKLSGSKQIISKKTGKALSMIKDGAVIDSYAFKNSQRWIIEKSGDQYLIKNTSSNKYLTCENYNLSLKDKNNADTQVWIIEDLGANWSSISNKTGGVLTIKDGSLAVCSKKLNNDEEKWDIYDAYIEDLPKSDTSWMVKDGYGIMYHMLIDRSSKSSTENRVNVKAICDQIEESGAKYFQLTLGQNSGYYIGPNEKLATMVSFDKLGRSTKRDIFMEFAKELKSRGIKLIAYSTTCPPTSDNVSFLAPTDKNNQPTNSRECAMLWGMVLREWSLHYGDLISGWWIDGGYVDNNRDPAIFTILANAVKAGNHKAVIAFNPGVIMASHAGTITDFTAGEINYPFGSDNINTITDRTKWVTPNTQPIKDSQWSMLTFLARGWCGSSSPRKSLYDTELWAELVTTIHKQGGTICMDVGYDRNYKINSNMMNILLAIKAKYYS